MATWAGFLVESISVLQNEAANSRFLLREAFCLEQVSQKWGAGRRAQSKARRSWSHCKLEVVSSSLLPTLTRKWNHQFHFSSCRLVVKSEIVLRFTALQGCEKWLTCHFARPCLIFLEYVERNIDKVYSSRREALWGGLFVLSRRTASRVDEHLLELSVAKIIGR